MPYIEGMFDALRNRFNPTSSPTTASRAGWLIPRVRKFSNPLGLLLAMIALQTAVASANSMTTIQLNSRPAEEVIPIVKPMLGDGDAISGHGFKIFLRASPATVADVRAMLDVLDQPAKVLQISVFQGSTRGLGELGIDGRLRIDGGDGSIAIGSGGNSTNSATVSTNRGSASIDGSSTRLRLVDRPIHQVRVTEGNEAYIEPGEQIPFFSGATWILPEGVAGGIEYRDVVTGFYVQPRISGERVTLRVSPFKNSLRNVAGGNIATQTASTTITGRLGDWLLIGGVSEELRQSQRGTASYSSTRSRSNESIWIKADLID